MTECQAFHKAEKMDKILGLVELGKLGHSSAS